MSKDFSRHIHLRSKNNRNYSTDTTETRSVAFLPVGFCVDQAEFTRLERAHRRKWCTEKGGHGAMADGRGIVVGHGKLTAQSGCVAVESKHWHLVEAPELGWDSRSPQAHAAAAGDAK